MSMLPNQGSWLAAFFYFFLHRGALGLVLLGTLDSSFLTLPFANDLAVVVLASVHHEVFWLYALAATAGSVLGCYIIYWVGRKGGESLIEAHVSKQQFERMQAKVSRRGPVLLALPALIPPPFPFSPWILAAGALDVPREKFMGALAVMRLIRFFSEAALALWVGKRVVQWLDTPSFRHCVEVLTVIALLASAYSIYKLVQSTRRRKPAKARSAGRVAA